CPVRGHPLRRRRGAEGHGVGRAAGRRALGPAARGAAREGPRVKPPRANAYRDTWCGTVDAARAGDEVRVAGWVHRRRDHGGLIFIDLRDRSGLLQLVFHPETAPEAHARAHDLRPEDVITAIGTVARREPDNVNPDLPTGEVELK